MNIKKIYGYLHNRYQHGYMYGYEMNIYLSSRDETNIYTLGRVRMSYYSYLTRPLTILFIPSH